jgi:hypothetical protein
VSSEDPKYRVIKIESTGDEEVDAIAFCLKALGPLDRATYNRSVEYLYRRSFDKHLWEQKSDDNPPTMAQSSSSSP